MLNKYRYVACGTTWNIQKLIQRNVQAQRPITAPPAAITPSLQAVYFIHGTRYYRKIVDSTRVLVRYSTTYITNELCTTVGP